LEFRRVLFRSLPCFVWKGFPTFRSHLRMRPDSRRHSRRGLVGGSTFRRTPIPRSPLDKTPKPGHLSELQPVNAVYTKGQFLRASFGKNPSFQIQRDKRPLSPGTSREAGGVPCLRGDGPWVTKRAESISLAEFQRFCCIVPQVLLGYRATPE